ncbi:MAG: hypothetical protein ACOYCB_09045 [Fastidiosipilaceae bacterium]|jgi:hypothetical protein
MVKQRVLPPYDDGLGDETFGEQMNALGVEVVKQKPELKNIKWVSGWKKNKPLVDKVCVNKSSISFGDEALKILLDRSTHKKLQLATADFRNQKVLVIKTSETGYVVVQGKTGRARAGSPGVMKKLQEHGLALGVYRVKKAKGGVICIPEEGQT